MKKKITLTKNKTTQWEQTYDNILLNGITSTTRRNYIRDVNYFAAWWSLINPEAPLYPVPVDTVLQFVIEHLHEMPEERMQSLIARKLKRKRTPLAIGSVRRILAAVSIAHTEKGMASPVSDNRVKLLMRRAKRARAGDALNRKAAITRDILLKMLGTCDSSLHGIRDRALLLVGFSSGGRRRSEIVNMKVSDLARIDQGFLLTLGKSKTDMMGKGLTVPILGKAAEALDAWLHASGIRDGYIFRGIWGRHKIGERIEGRAIARMVQRRIAEVGLDPSKFGAHSLRSGFMTESGRRGTHQQDAMQLSGHRDFEVANNYFRAGQLLSNPAAYLIDADAPDTAKRRAAKDEWLD